MDEPVGPDTISAPIAMASGDASARAVVALCARDRDERFELWPGARRWVIGSGSAADFLIDDPYVSRTHCVIERRGDGAVILHDCESKNGTIVDGSPAMSVELRPGAVIVLGRTYLVAVGEHDPGSAILALRGRDAAFRAAIDMALRAARSECSILIVGETGTGKDLVARAIHQASRRATGPFVAVNCGGFPRELVGAELFGHVRGAFTGAVESREGVFVEADGGTLFLDELGELPIDQQPHLLRALETRRVRPVGASYERCVDVRFVAATNRLEHLGTPQSALRFDLFQRIAAVTVRMPPLRERRGDIPELAEAFLAELAPRHGSRVLTAAALDALCAYDWPGNVRELKQTMLRALTLADGDIEVKDLALHPIAPIVHAPAPVLSRRAHEYKEIARSLERNRSIRAAARELGMPKSTFAEKARKLGLLASRKGKPEDDRDAE